MPVNFDPAEFGKAMGVLIRDAIEPLHRKIADLQAELKDLRAREPAKGEPGTSVTLVDVMQPIIENVRSEVARAVEALPTPKDGKSVDPEHVRRMVAEEVAALPPAAPGKDATPVDLDAAADLVVAKLLGSERIKTLVSAEAATAVEEHFEQNPVKDGDDGESVTDEQIERAVRCYLQLNPPAPGKSVTIEEVGVFLDAAVSKHVLDLERRASDTIGRVLDKIPVPKDGKDGVAMPVLDWDGERTFTIKAPTGEVLQIAKMPIPLDKGYWREGMRCEKGDVVTHDGVAWIALRDTNTKPCLTNKDDWRILARKGGKGDPGPPGKPGGPSVPVKLGGDK